MFFRGFRFYHTKTTRKFAVLLRLGSNVQGSRVLGCRRCANNINYHFSWKKVSSGPKNVERTGFSGFSEFTSGKRFANLLYCSDWAQTYRVAAYLIVEGAQIKNDHFNGKKILFWAKKRRKNGFFGIFRIYFRKTVRKFAVLL